jgi:hypothetical protein
MQPMKKKMPTELIAQAHRRTARPATRFLNHYYHAPCNTSWDDEWHCMSNDQCPTCGMKDIEPEESDDRLPEAIAEFLRVTPRTQVTIDAAIAWLISLGWNAEDLGPDYQRVEVEGELECQLRR